MNTLKSQNQIKHARKRAKQRFGFDYTSEERIFLTKCIRKKVQSDCMLWYSESNRIKHYLITYKEQLIHIVYDNVRGNIVTFLYPSQKAIEIKTQKDGEKKNKKKVKPKHRKIKASHKQALFDFLNLPPPKGGGFFFR